MRGADVAKASELWMQGRSVKWIAAQLNVSKSWVASLAFRNRDLFPRRYATRATREQRDRMRELRAGGMTCREIARLMGVNEKTVSRYTREERDGAGRQGDGRRRD